MKLPDVPPDIAAAAALEDEQQRRERQKRENQAIGEGSDKIPTADVLTLAEMLQDYAFIEQQSLVVKIGAGTLPMRWRGFQLARAASIEWITQSGAATPTPYSVTGLWLKDVGRKSFDTLTYRAGADRTTMAPATSTGLAAYNLWSPRAPAVPPGDWQEQAALFIDHVRWLFGDQAEQFLDWLAHIEQHPGVLPHSGWLHIAPNFGVGRNWIASVLVRIWPGDVASNLTMDELLGTFNEHRLSRRTIAIVDEVHGEQFAGAGRWPASQALKSRMTAEVVNINQKYGGTWLEWNALRMLVFSNYWKAIPLDKGERRFHVASCQDAPKDAGYYVKLYEALKNPGFLASVRHTLTVRDIKGFNPGERPQESAAKARVIRESQSVAERVLVRLVRNWPIDVIDAGTVAMFVRAEMDDPSKFTAINSHQRERAGVVVYENEHGDTRKVRVGDRVGGTSQRVYILRNHEQWQAAALKQVQAELAKPAADQARKQWEGLGA